MNAPDFLSDERIEKALEFLTHSAKDYAEAKGLRVWLEHKIKTHKSAAFLANEGSVAEREARAYVSDEYRSATDALRDAIVDEEKLRALRVAAEAKIEVWRSTQANLRAANI